MTSPSSSRRPKLVSALVDMLGFSPVLATITALLVLVLVASAVLWIMLSAPPRSITVTSGPVGSTFERYAEAYQKELAAHGVTLKIAPSGGSLDNLKALSAPKSAVDIGFVQGGLVGENPPAGLVSLGSVAYQPLWVFYRGIAHIDRLSELAGKRVSIGAPGSGVETLARALLEANGITGLPTTLDEQPSEDAAKAFLAGRLDAIFLTGDSAPTKLIGTLLRSESVQAFNFTQADAYVRRPALAYLNKIVMPQGAIDLGQNLPAQDVTLVGPGVELIAREGLNSAISDLLLDVAQKVHGSRPGLFAKRGEFPAPLEREFPISDDARRYYKSGRGFTYKLVGSFWLASLINRLLVVIVPLLLVMIPVLRFLPVAYRWSVQVRIYRYYRPLLQLERDAEPPLTSAHAKKLLGRLDAIEAEVNAMRVPASFASQFYDLRNHIGFVRQRLQAGTA